MNGPFVLQAALALAAGALSFVSPCVLPLLPVYVGFLGGPAAGREPRPVGEVAARTLLFVLGLGALFAAAATALVLLGQSISGLRGDIRVYGGALVLALGVAMLLAAFNRGIPWMQRTLQAAMPKAGGYGSAFLMGVVFSAGWTPCVGPVLAAILVQAGAESTLGRALVLLAVYFAGLGLPFFAAALLTDRTLRGLAFFRRHGSVVYGVSGVLLMAMGLLLVTDTFTLLNQLIPVTLPI
ncbi:MAG: cytochrome c biogenesis CcdA family protein [Candidatus Dormibacteria bacterium]